MPDPLQILLIRHAPSSWNEEHRWQGWGDPPLSAQGRQQAHRAAIALRPESFAAVVSSDLVRAQQTAAILAEWLSLTVVTEPRLRERNIGLWTGLTSPEIDARWPGARDNYRRDPRIDLPQAESSAALLDRAIVGLQEMARRYARGAAVLAVSHGGLIRCLHGHLGLPMVDLPQLSGRWLEMPPDGGIHVGRVWSVDRLDRSGGQ